MLTITHEEAAAAIARLERGGNPFAVHDAAARVLANCGWDPVQRDPGIGEIIAANVDSIADAARCQRAVEMQLRARPLRSTAQYEELALCIVRRALML